jgi:hypothetical protein
MKPKFLVIANGFNGRSIGHFHFYFHEGKRYPAREMSKMFWTFLRAQGYRRLATKIWNDRPSIWGLSVF